MLYPGALHTTTVSPLAIPRHQCNQSHRKTEKKGQDFQGLWIGIYDYVLIMNCLLAVSYGSRFWKENLSAGKSATVNGLYWISKIKPVPWYSHELPLGLGWEFGFNGSPTKHMSIQC